MQVSAQSWQGLAADEDERYRVASTADGGIWLLRHAVPPTGGGAARTRRVVDTTRRLLGVPLWAHEGLSRAEGTPVVDAELIRGLAVGQAAYIYRGGVSYVQVKRLVAEPAQPAAGPADAVPAPAAAVPAPAAAVRVRPRRPAWPDVIGQPDGLAGARMLADIGPLLDEAFGAERDSG